MAKTYAQQYMPHHVCVSISGIIGAGKTTLINRLSETLKWPVAEEPLDESMGSYLCNFYEALDELGAAKAGAESLCATDAALTRLKHAKSAAASASFGMQINIVDKRFRMYRHALDRGADVLLDRSLFEDAIFANALANDGVITPLDMGTYVAHFETLKTLVGPLDAVVFLDVTPEVALERIRARGRECEKGITADYLRGLQAGYEDWLSTLRGTAVIRVPWDKYGNPEDVADQILTTLGRK